MTARRARSWPVVGLLTVLVGCGSAPALVDPPVAARTPASAVPLPGPDAAPSRSSYGFYAPYDRAASSAREAPPGFTPFYLQNVGRHGSRATISSTSFRTVEDLCELAASRGELTELGAAFCADADLLRAASRRTGYGDLSPLGEQQWEEIGARTADDYRAFFTAAARAEAPIRFVTSEVDRAQDSSDAFRRGISSEMSGLKLKKRVTDDDLLRFSTPITPGSRLEIARVERSAATQIAATNVLRRLFGTTSSTLDDARDVWDLYAIAPGMGARLDAYLSPADAAQLAALDDAETFYRYGPSVEGGGAFDSAADLRAELLEVIQHHLDGGTAMATFRHAHAETVVPLAALLRLGPTSEPVARGASAADHGWRGSEDAEMAVNIDLAAYREGRTVLVTVRFDEEPVEVRGCAPSTYGRYFYDLETLKTCWS